MEEFDEHFYCPICRDIFMTPKLYDCGHTICEKCMKKMDETEEDKVSTFDAPIYSCPICRFKTLSSYKNRPVNRKLIEVLKKNQKYVELIKDIEEPESEDLIEKYKNLNFSKMTFKNKFIKTEKYYKQLLPVIYEASINGKSKISILKDTKDLQSISKMLSIKLFRHGIYKIQATPREFIIHLLPENSGYSSELVNPIYSNNNNNFNQITINPDEEYNNLFANRSNSLNNLLTSFNLS